jgi:hypothetical protein
LVHLIHTSSPQPSKEGVTPRSAAGFRRANSCGNQFPKRRRVGGSDGDDVFTESATIGPSKLAVLIERVQEGLAKPKNPPRSTASSSSFHTPPGRPQSLVEDGNHVDYKCGKVVEKPLTEPCLLKNEAVRMGTGSNVRPQPPQVANSNSSDYGEFEDDELDVTLLEVFVDGATPQVFARSVPKLPPKPPQQDHSVQARCKPPAQGEASETFESGTLQAESDEYDDSDEDLFTADFENIASQFETKANGMSEVLSAAVGRAGNPEQLKPVGKLKSESEDEFGDDGLDDSDFETAEATATQSMQQTANGLSSVRTRFP